MTAAETTPALELTGLTKAYRIGHLRPSRKTALEDLTLSVPRGEIFGFLGPNGAGKTTTLKILMGLLRPDRGSARVLGCALTDRRWRYRAGYLPEQPYFYDYLTGAEYLDYAGRLSGLGRADRQERASQWLRRVGLREAAGTSVRRYSKGMLQRLGLAQALLHDPEIVFLDEPMSGLDPIGRRLARRLILELRQSGKTVFFSTHILSDAEAMCDRVAVVRRGRLVATGRLDEILDVSVSHLDVLVSGLDDAALGSLPGTPPFRRLGERASLDVPEAGLGALIAEVEKRRGRVLAVLPVRQSLEDYFFKEMGASAEEETWEA